MTPSSKQKRELTKLSHDFVRIRDSTKPYEIAGNCFDCGIFVQGQQFQAGHWIADSVGGALLRYHPYNMHGQSGGCNMKYSQERVKIEYTFKMLEKYGKKEVEKLRQMKNKTIKADNVFYEKMIELYKEGNEKKIVKYLETLAE